VVNKKGFLVGSPWSVLWFSECEATVQWTRQKPRLRGQ
jgi:hypothetical protein